MVAVNVTGLPKLTEAAEVARATDGATTSVVASVADCPLASVTCTVKWDLPVAVAVPASVPVAGSSVIPAGRFPLLTDQV